MPLARWTLTKDRWPDKALYGAVLLFVAGFLGILHGILGSLAGVEFSSRAFAFVEDYPAWLTLLLSIAAVVLAAVSLRLRRTRYSMLGCAAAIASFGLFLLEPIFALLALAFLVRSKLEREEANPETVRLTARMWPDKTLAASMLQLVTGVLTLGWWLGSLSRVVSAETVGSLPEAYAALGLVTGCLSLAAAWTLYYQRGLALAVVAGVGGVVGLGLVVVAPATSVASLVLVALGWREGEFENPLVP